MTHDDIHNDPITECKANDGSASEPGTEEVDTVNVRLRIDAAKWSAAVASASDAAVLIAYIDAQRIG
jgi:hypothetical protein